MTSCPSKDTDKVRFNLIKQIAFFKEQYSAIQTDVRNFHQYSQLIEKDFDEISQDIFRVRLRIKQKSFDSRSTKQLNYSGNQSLQEARHLSRPSDEIDNEIRFREQEFENLVQTRKRIHQQKQLLINQLSVMKVAREHMRQEARMLSKRLDRLQEVVRFQNAHKELEDISNANLFD